MTIQRIDKAIKAIFGDNYFVRQNPNNEDIYEVLHTIGINGAIGSARGWCYVDGNSIKFRYVWERDANSAALKAKSAGRVVVKQEHDWWVVLVYLDE